MLWQPKSHVHKLGGIPASTTNGSTCPNHCSLKGDGCYAEFGTGGNWWRRLSRGDAGVGITWKAFIRAVEALPKGQLWRHNLAGDLPGSGNDIDRALLDTLVVANLMSMARGFTFTHKPALKSALVRDAVARANHYRFAVNLSADSPHEADALFDLAIGPVVSVVEHDAPERSQTPAGRDILVCPAQRDERATCKSCGWCARIDRDWIVGFRAHGQMKKRVSLRIAKAAL